MSSIDNTPSTNRQDGLNNYNINIDDMKKLFELESFLKKNIKKNYNLGYLKLISIFSNEKNETYIENDDFPKMQKSHFGLTKKASEDREIILDEYNSDAAKARRKSQFIKETLNAKKKTNKKK